MTRLDKALGMENSDLRMAHLRMVCEGLLFKIVQQSRDHNNGGFVVALTSPTPGSGVSHITRALADSLRKGGGQFAISLDCWHLEHDSSDSADPAIVASRKSVNSFWEPPRSEGFLHNWHSVQETVVESLNKLRAKYRYILIDCPSLKETPDALRLAPLVDGIVLVIEANRTQKEHILYAERTLERARGRILGHVLNKRTYVIPDWLSRRMEAVGL
jgi:Mrp family chromosome partitioning ATPase